MRELRTILNSEGIGLKEMLARGQTWYGANIQPMGVDRILTDASFATEVALSNAISGAGA